MFKFSTAELMDQKKCYDLLVDIFHPEGICCPKCKNPIENTTVHRRERAPILYHQCPCSRVFNIFTNTVLQGTHKRCSEIVCVFQGILKGTSTKHLAEELEFDRKHLLEFRHRLQEFLSDNASRLPALPDDVVEADEMYQNAGEKGVRHPDPEDPPRKRGNQARGHGTWDNDRPPVLGIVGRESGEIRLEVKTNSGRVDLEPSVISATLPGTVINTDEWGAYNHLSDEDREHVTVCHTPGKREWARDDDGDGVREVHSNTIEGFWTGLRNFLRPFRGVNKVYLQQYIAVHQWAHNLKIVSIDVLRKLCGVTQLAP